MYYNIHLPSSENLFVQTTVMAVQHDEHVHDGPLHLHTKLIVFPFYRHKRPPCLGGGIRRLGISASTPY